MKGTIKRCRREEIKKYDRRQWESKKERNVNESKIERMLIFGINRKDGKGKIKKRNIVIIIKSVLTVELRWFQSWLLIRILYMNEKIREYLEIQKSKK